MFEYIRLKFNKVLHTMRTECEDEQWLLEVEGRRWILFSLDPEYNSTEHYTLLRILDQIKDVGTEKV